jgi:hypothetical protein
VRTFGLVSYALDKALAKMTGRLSDNESHLVVQYGNKTMLWDIIGTLMWDNGQR